VLKEHEAMVVFRVAVHRVQETARFGSGASHVLQAELDGTLELIGAHSDTAGDDEHGCDAMTNALSIARYMPFCGPSLDSRSRWFGQTTQPLRRRAVKHCAMVCNVTNMPPIRSARRERATSSVATATKPPSASPAMVVVKTRPSGARAGRVTFRDLL